MRQKLSTRLQAVLDALPLKPGLRVLEVGCGPGALARAMAEQVAPGHVLGIDRSARAIAQAVAAASDTIVAGSLSFRQVAAVDFFLATGEAPFDLIVAVRVGAFDGRHPEAGARAWPRMAAALAPGGCVVVDGVAYAREGRRGAFLLALDRSATSSPRRASSGPARPRDRHAIER
jgi:cyclopropane fatty-acyl-phospholipid synthase-like methyltransferase